MTIIFIKATLKGILLVLTLTDLGYDCYEDKRHGGNGGFTEGYVCEVPKDWRKIVREFE